MADAYPTATQVKTFLGISSSGDDTTIGYIVDGVTDFIERYCGRSFVDAAAQTIKVMPEYPNLLGRRELLIKDWDVVSVTSITNGDGETISDYTLLPLNGPPYYKIEIDLDAGQVWNRGSDGAGVVTIVCTTGYASAVPNDIYLAFIQLCAWLYRARSAGAGGAVTTATREGLTIAPSEIPPNIRETLDLYKRQHG